MLDAERQGRSIVYRLNESHWLVRAGLRPLFAAEADGHTRLGEVVRRAAGVPVHSVILFGSEARGEARAGSDLDVVCLTKTKSGQTRAGVEARLATAAGEIHRQFGRRVSVLVWSAREFVRRYRARDPLVREIVETGWVIAGASLSEVVR
jgi:predicted nucleotidyltransferase